MALEVVSFVDEARYPAAAVRRLAFNAAGGNTSIVEPGAYKVVATVPPSDKVLVYLGSADLVSAHTSGEVYGVRNNATEQVAIPANTGSSPVTRRVWVEVRDPSQAGMPARAGDTDPMARLMVGSVLPVDRPVLPCGTVTVPAQTGTITDAMIRDDRPFPNARQLADQSMRFPPADVNMAKQSAGKDYQSWPLSDFAVQVPPWATRLQADAIINGVEWTGTGAGKAGVRMIFATAPSQNGIITADGKSRQTVAVMGDWIVPASLRGTTAYIGVQGLQTEGTGEFQQDYQSQVNLRWVFREERV